MGRVETRPILPIPTYLLRAMGRVDCQAVKRGWSLKKVEKYIRRLNESQMLQAANNFGLELKTTLLTHRYNGWTTTILLRYLYNIVYIFGRFYITACSLD